MNTRINYAGAQHHSIAEVDNYVRSLEAERHRLYDVLERIVELYKDGEPDTIALLARMTLEDRYA